jgi:hypothetical protein
MTTRHIATHLSLGIVALIVLCPTAKVRADGGPSSRPAATQPATRPSVNDLVSQLSSPNWRERRRAGEALAAIGPAAEGELRTLADAGHLSGEARASVERLLRDFQEKRRVGATLVTLHAHTVPSAQAIENILAQAKLGLAPQAKSMLQDAKPIDIDVEKVPVWDAMIDLCGRCGMAFYSVNEGGLVDLVKPDADHPAPPVATSGPFIMTVARVVTVAKRSEDFAAVRPTNGIMNHERGLEPCRIYVYAWAEPRLKPLRWIFESVEVGQTDKGQTLTVDPATKRELWGGGTINQKRDSSIVLDGPFEGARQLRSLRVSVRFALELDRQHLEIPDVLNVHNGVYNLGGYRLNLKGVNKVVDGKYGYEYSLFRDGGNPADWQVLETTVTARLLDAQGRPLNMQGGSSMYNPNEIRNTQTVMVDAAKGKTGEPARLVFDAPCKFEHRPAVFEFKELPLPR